MEREFLELLTTISWPAALFGLAYLLKPFYGPLAGKINDHRLSKSVEDLLKFKYKTEQNHFGDLAQLMSDVKEIKLQLEELSRKVAHIEGRLEGPYNQK